MCIYKHIMTYAHTYTRIHTHAHTYTLLVQVQSSQGSSQRRANTSRDDLASHRGKKVVTLSLPSLHSHSFLPSSLSYLPFSLPSHAVQVPSDAALDGRGGDEGRLTRKQVRTCILGVWRNNGGGGVKIWGGVAKIWGGVAKI